MALRSVSVDWAAVLAVVGGSSLFGTSGVARALVQDGTSSVAIGATRVLIGGAILVAFALWHGHRFSAARRLPVTTLVLGLAVAVFQSFFFSAVTRIGVAIAAIVTLAVVPAATGFIGYLVRRQAPTGRWYPATALAVAGAIGVSGTGAGNADVLGVVLSVTAGCSVAVYTVLSRRLLDAGAHVTEVTTIALALSGLVLLPALTLSQPDWLATTRGVTVAIYLGVFTAALAFWLNAKGISRIQPASVATLNLSEPVTAVLLAFILLGERLTALQLAGAIAVVLALTALALEQRRPPLTTATPSPSAVTLPQEVETPRAVRNLWMTSRNRSTANCSDEQEQDEVRPQRLI